MHPRHSRLTSARSASCFLLECLNAEPHPRSAAELSAVIVRDVVEARTPNKWSRIVSWISIGRPQNVNLGVGAEFGVVLAASKRSQGPQTMGRGTSWRSCCGNGVLRGRRGGDIFDTSLSSSGGRCRKEIGVEGPREAGVEAVIRAGEPVVTLSSVPRIFALSAMIVVCCCELIAQMWTCPPCRTYVIQPYLLLKYRCECNPKSVSAFV